MQKFHYIRYNRQIFLCYGFLCKMEKIIMKSIMWRKFSLRTRRGGKWKVEKTTCKQSWHTNLVSDIAVDSASNIVLNLVSTLVQSPRRPQMVHVACKTILVSHYGIMVNHIFDGLQPWDMIMGQTTLTKPNLVANQSLSASLFPITSC